MNNKIYLSFQRSLTRRRGIFFFVAVPLVLAAAALWFVINRHLVPVASGQTPATMQSVRSDPEVLQYPQGALQLSAVQSRVIAMSRLPITDSLSGRLIYDEDNTARIGVGISGRIVAVKVAPGDAVTAGQVLAEIDSPDLGTAVADLNKSHADESRKRLAVERARDLVPGEAIALKDFELLQADLAQAHAETARAEQRIDNLNPRRTAIRGQRLNLTTPISGIVTERAATPALEVGTSLAAPLFVVTNPSRLWLMIDVPEKLLGKVKPGGTVQVESDAYPGVAFTAKIAQRGLLVDPNSRRVAVRATLDNPELRLLPEMFVRARLLEQASSGVRVPNSALVNVGVNTYVFVQSASTQFTRRKVSLLTQGGDDSYVGDGLKGGERVVITGALLLDGELQARAGAQP